MHSAALFTVVASAFGMTAVLHNTHPLEFYRACMLFQCTTLVGIALRLPLLIQAGHLAFVVLLYVGSFLLPMTDVWLAPCLSVVTLLTRKLFGDCLFDLASQTTLVHVDGLADLYFTGPLVIACVRIMWTD